MRTMVLLGFGVGHWLAVAEPAERLGFERREEESGAGRGAGGAERERGEVGKEQSLFYCLLRLITSPCIYSPSGLVSQATI